jgi:microcystin-dependent protein
MAEPFVGEIRMFAGNFAPRGWALCDGQLLAVSQNDALFSLLGTIYGGDGRTTFGLPDLRGRIPVHEGSGPGLTPRSLGQRGGSETVTLSESQLASHGHRLRAVGARGTSGDPQGRLLAGSTVNAYGAPTNPGSMSADALDAAGVNFIIALFGVFPSS